MGDRIRLQNMVFYGRHGVLPAEQELGQRFEVDVELLLDLAAAGARDELAATVDYSAVYGLVKGIVEGRPFRLVEALAEAVAAAVLAHFAAPAVRVRVRKPHAPLGGPVDHVEVEIERRRPG